LNTAKLNWKKVLTKDAFSIGEVQGGEVDPKTWQLTHFHISLYDKTLKEFGLNKPFMGQVLICLPVEYVQEVDDAVTLKLSFEELKNTKECQEYITK
jgi:sporulation protein YlmC with PRC-barrel domain